MTPERLTRPYVGLSPAIPQKAAGVRIDPLQKRFRQLDRGKVARTNQRRELGNGIEMQFDFHAFGNLNCKAGS